MSLEDKIITEAYSALKYSTPESALLSPFFVLKKELWKAAGEGETEKLANGKEYAAAFTKQLEKRFLNGRSFVDLSKDRNARAPEKVAVLFSAFKVSQTSLCTRISLPANGFFTVVQTGYRYTQFECENVAVSPDTVFELGLGLKTYGNEGWSVGLRSNDFFMGIALDDSGAGMKGSTDIFCYYYDESGCYRDLLKKYAQPEITLPRVADTKQF